MKRLFLSSILIIIFFCCLFFSFTNEKVSTPDTLLNSGNSTLETRIEVPEGYARLHVPENSFAHFVRTYPLKEKNHKVHLYNGKLKSKQNIHVAVFDLPLEAYDLQQCADSVMRFYAEYFFQTKQDEKIAFHFTNGFLADWETWKHGKKISVVQNTVTWVSSVPDDSYTSFVQYLKCVFMYAGTLSMAYYETQPTTIQQAKIGDVFLQGGSPGHVVMIVDVAEKNNKKAFLLAQGFMPSQEFHILKNPAHSDDPWYYEDEITYPLKTPEWTFNKDCLYTLTY